MENCLWFTYPFSSNLKSHVQVFSKQKIFC
jgi:hypothetical protein